MKAEDYAEEFRFFERYASGRLTKLAEKARAGLAGEISAAELAAALLPLRLYPGGRDRGLELKYSADQKILERRLPHLFGTGSLSFLGYSFDYLFEDRRGNRHVVLLFNLLSMLNEIFLREQYGEVTANTLRRGEPVVMDCGANMGVFSLYAHALNPAARIYAFEPSAYTCGLLRKAVERNGLSDSVFPVNAALGQEERTVGLNVVREGAGLSNVVVDSEFAAGREADYKGVQQTEMTTLDLFARKNGLSRVDLIKIDTEGYEKQILRGAAGTIRKFKPVITCSAYHLKGDLEEIPRLVHELVPEYKSVLETRGDPNFVFWT